MACVMQTSMVLAWTIRIDSYSILSIPSQFHGQSVWYRLNPLIFFYQLVVDEIAPYTTLHCYIMSNT